MLQKCSACGTPFTQQSKDNVSTSLDHKEKNRQQNGYHTGWQRRSFNIVCNARPMLMWKNQRSIGIPDDTTHNPRMVGHILLHMWHVRMGSPMRSRFNFIFIQERVWHLSRKKIRILSRCVVILRRQYIHCLIFVLKFTDTKKWSNAKWWMLPYIIPIS